MRESNRSVISCTCAIALLLAACAPDDGEKPHQPLTAAGASGQSPAGNGSGPSGSAAPAGTGAAGQSGLAGSLAVAGAPAGQAGMAAAGRGGVAGMMGMPRGGRSGAAGAAPPAMPVTNPDMCPAAPADATPAAVAALAAVNTVRVASGAGCATLVNTISAGATAHCNYYVMYMAGDMCISNPHGEVMGCAGFTGASPGARIKAAGYTLGGGGEIMAFFNDPQRAVDIWVNSVWHRTPILDPSTGDMGYGAAARCDVIDFGRGVMAPATALVVYPYDGQVNVPTSFNGANEGPMPPAPTTGWPSASPISVHGKALVVTEHVLTIDGDPAPIEHVWLDANASIVAMDMRRSLTNVNFMYANAPFAASSKYRVKIVGTYGGGMISKEWTFTTGMASRRGF